YQEAVERLTDWAHDTRRQFAEYDVVLTPVQAYTPPPVSTVSAKEAEEDDEYQGKFTPHPPSNDVVGVPAVSEPIQHDEKVMSWSVQAIGRIGAEDQLLRLGARLEALVAERRSEK